MRLFYSLAAQAIIQPAEPAGDGSDGRRCLWSTMMALCASDARSARARWLDCRDLSGQFRGGPFLEAYWSGRRRVPPCRCPDARHGRARIVAANSKSGGSHLPAIMITGQGDVPMAVEAMNAGAVDFIEKPIRRDELTASIERALEHTPGFGQAVGLAGRGSVTARRPDRAAASDHGTGARRSSEQKHRRRLGISRRTVE